MRQWLQNLFARKPSRPLRHSRFRPTLEPLGERLAPATFNVINLNESGTGSLRKAIADANTSAGHDTITFQPGLAGTVTLTSGQLRVTSVLTIQGPGAEVLAVSGNQASRIFEAGPAACAISGLTLTAGKGAIVPGQSTGGGAIWNHGNLTLSHCTLSGNSAERGGGLYNDNATATLAHCTLSGNSADSGGGYYGIGGTATFTQCTLSANSARLGGGLFILNGTASLAHCTLTGNSAVSGGGLRNEGTATLSHCTLSGNSADSSGGGIVNLGTTTLTNCTLSGNSADFGGGLANGNTATLTNCTLSGNAANVEGGGIYNQRTVTLHNTIVADSPAGGDVFLTGVGTLAGSHNLIEDGSGGLADTVSGTPHLGPLQDNGGPTWTHALLPNSPARDAGSDALAVDGAGTPLAFDQRGPGFSRLLGSAVDIGAFEGTPPPPSPPSPPPTTPTPEPRVTFRLVRRSKRALLHAINEQTGETRFVRLAFGARATKVRLRTVADFNGDGVLDAVVTARVGGRVRRKVFSGENGAMLR